MSSPKALVILADGSEEMEAVIVIDVLRRAHINVLVAGLQSAESIRCSRNVVIKPDTSLADALDRAALFDVIVLPGGADGATAFAESAKVGEALSEQERRGSLIAAICAAPIALQRHKIALGRQLTSHPSKATQLRESYQYTESRVQVDGNLVTSRGPGTAFEFALEIVRQLLDKQKADALIGPMLLKL